MGINLAPQENPMKVSESMTRNPHLTSPKATLREAAQMMAERDIGLLLVGENDRLTGIVTDRDIAIRGIAAGKEPSTAVREVMSDKIRYCYEDQSIEEVAQNMSELRVRRLPVVNRAKRLVGVLSLGDIAKADGQETLTGSALRHISSQPGREAGRSGRSSAAGDRARA
jgi:CBS domain-containing protein